MEKILIPASVPKNKKGEYEKNYRLLTNNTGHLLLIADDQKTEHLNDDFFGPGIDQADNNPEHLFQIAAASRGGILAAHPGLISRYGRDYAQLPYIIKINGKTNIGPNEEKDTSATWWDVADVIKFRAQSGLKIAGIGYTVHIGGKYETAILRAAAKAIFEAHQAGLTAVIWMYPRGKNVKEEDVHTIAGGAGVAVSLDADFVKVKYPYGTKDRTLTAKKFSEVVSAAGRTKVICVGGAKRTAKDLLTDLEGQMRLAGTSGVAMGRNLHQRSFAEANRLTAALGSIIFKKASAREALAIYSDKGKLSSHGQTRKKFLGLL